MATATDGEAKGCIFQWKIQNLSHCWWLEKSQEIVSPAFIADELDGTKWSLSLYPMGYTVDQSIGVFINRESDCDGPIDIEVYCTLAFLDKDGFLLKKGIKPNETFKKSETRGWNDFMDRETVFVNRREIFLPEDSLTVQCTLCNCIKMPIRPKYMYAQTVFTANRRSFVWKIDQPSSPESKHEKRYKDHLISFKLVFNKQRAELKLDEVLFDDSLRWISCTVSAIDLEEKKETCGIQGYSRNDLKHKPLLMLPYPEIAMENPNRYLRINFLPLEFVFWIGQCTSSIKNFVKFDQDAETEGHPQSRVLTEDLESMFNEENFTDMEIRTAGKSFKVHKVVLSARSPVFQRMFLTEMLEDKRGYVEIVDFDEDTVEQMLRHTYTDTVKYRGFQNVEDLYRIADKYELETLKRRCSCILQEELQLTNVLAVLVLADRHNDTRLKDAVIDYIMGLNRVFFKLQEWKDFMENHVQLTIDVLYKKVCLG